MIQIGNSPSQVRFNFDQQQHQHGKEHQTPNTSAYENSIIQAELLMTENDETISEEQQHKQNHLTLTFGLNSGR